MTHSEGGPTASDAGVGTISASVFTWSLHVAALLVSYVAQATCRQISRL